MDNEKFSLIYSIYAYIFWINETVQGPKCKKT